MAFLAKSVDSILRFHLARTFLPHLVPQLSPPELDTFPSIESWMISFMSGALKCIFLEFGDLETQDQVVSDLACSTVSLLVCRRMLSCGVLIGPLSALLGILFLVMAPIWPNLPLLISLKFLSLNTQSAHIPMGVLWVWTLVSPIWKDTVQFTIPNLWTFNYLLQDLLPFQSIN